jgi:DnaJ family protein C protein 13
MSQFEFVDQFNNIKSVANFSVFKKHPWRGKYKRIFCIGENQLFTRNVSRLSITNVWIYSQQVIDVKPISSHVDAFLLTTKNGHKTSILTFVSKERAALLSYCNRYRESFCSRARSSENTSDYFLCEKLSWNRKRVSANLCLTTYSINQIHLENKTITKNYFYKDINKFFFPYDNTDAIIFSYGSSGNAKLFKGYTSISVVNVKIWLKKFLNWLLLSLELRSPLKLLVHSV